MTSTSCAAPNAALRAAVAARRVASPAPRASAAPSRLPRGRRAAAAALRHVIVVASSSSDDASADDNAATSSTSSSSLPPTATIAAQGVEGYVSVLERAYADEALGNEVRDRMQTDRLFSIGIKQCMNDATHADRLRAAIDASPYMKAAAEEEQRRRAEVDAVQSIANDEGVQARLADMAQNNPELLRQTQENAEATLKKVAGELVDGVKAYREEFEPNADDLIAKFTEISNEGYAAFVKHSMSDVNVKNAVINALYDEMEDAQKNAATAKAGGGGGEE